MKRNTVLNFFVMTSGLFIMTLGIAVSAKAGLGTTPISCLPYVLSLAFPLTFGMFTFIINCFFVLFQYLILKERFESYQLLQIPQIFVFGVFTDYSMFLVSGLEITGYRWQWAFCLLSCVIVGLGVALLFKGNLLMMAGDALVRAVSQGTKFEFGSVKVGFDTSMVVIATIVSLIMFSAFNGVREGTIAAAVLVGLVVKFFVPRLSFMDKLFCENVSKDNISVNRN
ncbi:YczE/YyaS/YitT family protein [Methanolacinia petrolearia]|uniref:YczE/YyaS/YitT family protein n=1 Tax=Methanolacinia petrolearia TaxID=54120 RepID=UPI003BA989C3